jgi:penicillin-binding protein 2
MYLRGDNRPPATSQFSFRVAVLSGAALLIFSIIFLRLWYLQVLSGDRYLAEAQNNQIRELRVQAPRGKIVDRNGKVLVDNRTALALQLTPQELPHRHRDRKRVIERLSGVADMSADEIRKEIRVQTKELPASPVTLRRDVGYPLVYYLQEHQADLPGVAVERVFVRRYPKGSVGAHIFGYPREVTEEQLEEPRYEQLEPGDQIGQTGVEYQYDHLLRGQPGATRLQVDALGRPRGGELSSEQAVPGNDLRLTVDAGVQETGEAALSSFDGLPGAFVAMDVRNGEVLGLGSYPSFDPEVFTRPIVSESTYKRLSSEATDDPLSNRAIQGLYPTGSTFKAITATAALEEGLITPDTVINDTGSLKLDAVTFKNAGDQVFGPISLAEAIKVSSDVFFYNLGLDSEQEGSDPIQRWAEALGIGSPTGIDLPAEEEGLVPTPEWRNELFQQAQDPDSPGGEKALFEEGETDRPWSAGDAVNLSVGQGDLQTNPLQLAVAYAAIANGGDLVRPHVAQQVEDSSGRVIQEIRPAPRRHLDISAGHRQVIMDGLHAAAMEPGGTSYAVFGNWKIDVAGKTGTAERGNLADQSWYVALAPYPDPKLVVAVTIEGGGFGADSAAPAASQILAEALDTEPGAPASGVSPAQGATAGSYD